MGSNLKVNPMKLIGAIKNGQNPQQLMLNILKDNMKDNPLYEDLSSLAQNNDSAGVEKVIRNAMRNQGIDFDVEFKKFKDSMGLK